MKDKKKKPILYEKYKAQQGYTSSVDDCEMTDMDIVLHNTVRVLKGIILAIVAAIILGLAAIGVLALYDPATRISLMRFIL